MRYVGFHAINSLPFKQFDQVLLLKGTKIATTNPTKAPFYYADKMKLIVVDHLTSGIISDNEPVQNPLVVWRDGDYYHSADINCFFPEEPAYATEKS